MQDQKDFERKEKHFQVLYNLAFKNLKLLKAIFSYLKSARFQAWEMSYSCFADNVSSAKYLLSTWVLHSSQESPLEDTMKRELFALRALTV